MPEKTATSAIEVVQRHMAAEDRQDVDAAVACFTDDCYYRVPGLGVELRGKDGIRGWHQDLFSAVPDFSNTDECYWESDGTVFFEANIGGTHRGTWEGWAPTNRRFSTRLLVRIPIAADGLMEAEVVYLDTVDIFTQLGILPKPGSAQERVMQAVHRLRRRVASLR